jgi:hypothetical protein
MFYRYLRRWAFKRGLRQDKYVEFYFSNDVMILYATMHRVLSTSVLLYTHHDVCTPMQRQRPGLLAGTMRKKIRICEPKIGDCFSDTAFIVK